MKLVVLGNVRDAMEKLAGAMSELASTLAGVLAESLGYSRKGFPVSYNKSTCFLRLNHYPPCPLSAEVFGLMPHTTVTSSQSSTKIKLGDCS